MTSDYIAYSYSFINTRIGHPKCPLVKQTSFMRLDLLWEMVREQLVGVGFLCPVGPRV